MPDPATGAGPQRAISAAGRREVSDGQAACFAGFAGSPGLEGLWRWRRLILFFGEEQEGLLDAVMRAVRAVGELQSAADLAERARTLSQYAEQQDRDFTYSITSSASSTPAPSWDELPYLQMEVIAPKDKVTVTAWSREGGASEQASFWFAENEAGRQARAEALWRWARGEEAVITGGAHIRFSTPELMRQLLPDREALAGGRLRLSAGAAFDAEFEVQTADGVEQRQFDVRPVPPRPGAFGALAGLVGSVLFEVNFERVDERHVAAKFSLSTNFGPDAHDSADAAALLHAWCTQERATFRSPVLFPDGIGGRSEDIASAGLCEEMEWRREFYADVAYLEDRLGIDLPLPQEMTGDDLDGVGTAANVLRTGEGTATFTEATGFVEDPLEIPRLPEDLRQRGSVRRMVTYTVFGQELPVGLLVVYGFHRTKSGNNAYVLSDSAMELLEVDESEWDERLADFVGSDPNRRLRRLQQRASAKVQAATGAAGKHAALIEAAVDALLQSRCKDFDLVFVDDADGNRIGEKWQVKLEAFDLMPDLSSRWPDAILVKGQEVWFVDAVTTDGEIDEVRKQDLERWVAQKGFTVAGHTTAYENWKRAGARQSTMKNLAVGSTFWIAEDGGKLFVVEPLV